jgi:uncharacterized membrane protein YdfJ with MMPL/SSD domain
MSSARRLTGAAGRWSATHPWTAIIAWLGCVVVLLVAGHMVGTFQLSDSEQDVGQAEQAEQMMSQGFPPHATEYVLFDSPSLQVGAPAYQAAIRDVLARIQATGRVTQVHSPLDPAYANQVSANRQAALLQFQVTGNINDDATQVVPVLAAVRAAAAAHPQVQIAETGTASIDKAASDTVFRDLHRAEALSFPITLVVLLIAFGAVVAALLPLGLAVMAILAATGLLAFTSHLSGATETASAVMLLIGLAVGVDYSMFYVKREREERAAGRPVLDAIEVAAGTSGRSVLISGLTVLAAMSAMFLTGDKPGRGRAARRDHRPGVPAARHDGAARPAELVPAPLAGVAAADLPRNPAAADQAIAEAAGSVGQAVRPFRPPGQASRPPGQGRQAPARGHMGCR